MKLTTRQLPRVGVNAELVHFQHAGYGIRGIFYAKAPNSLELLDGCDCQVYHSLAWGILSENFVGSLLKKRIFTSDI